MAPNLVPIVASAAAGLLAAISWLWLGRAPGRVKRLVFRALLFVVALALVYAGRARGIFAHASVPFDLALAAIILLVVFGNLYAVRFCTACGRMHRNFKAPVCARCGRALPRHGFTEEPRRPALDPTDPLGRKRRPEPAPRGPRTLG